MGTWAWRSCPQPDDGDVFLDFEGHPFWRPDTGLFFLFGLLERDADGQWDYRTGGRTTSSRRPTAAERADRLPRRPARAVPRTCTSTTTTTPNARRCSVWPTTITASPKPS